MSHYVGDHVAPTVDSSGGGIGHILMTRFSHSRLLPKPAIFRPSPPPFPGVLTSRPPSPDRGDSWCRLRLSGHRRRLPTGQTRTELSATPQAAPLLFLPPLPSEVPAAGGPSLVS